MSNTSLPTLGVQLGSSLPPGELPGFAARCEHLGFRQVWIAEDYFSYGGIAAAATVLAATERTIVGIGVLASAVRHPAVAAMEFAQLAQAFPGRVIAGIGHGAPGWMRQMGLKQRSPLTALEECAVGIRALLRGATLTEQGDYFEFDRIGLRHVPPDPVPLFAGVHGAKSLALSGRVADGTLLGWFSSPAYVRWAIEQIQAGSPTPGYGHTVSTLAVTSIDRDGVGARKRIIGFVTENVEVMTASPQITVTGSSGRSGDEFDLDTYAVAGDPDRCATSVRNLLDAGSHQVVFVTSPGGLVDGDSMRRQVELLAETILPVMGSAAV
jgi:alkanesulfonate monooxygenase SsuD/methylene tetrahydromethanopterin reductase-like flavin-dependent oxidoreductase (luciferase family)